jgi:hypothetical protein
MNMVSQLLLFWIAANLFYTADCHAQKTEPTKNSIRVIAFLDTECPISQRYMAELQKLSQTYMDKGVGFESYFPVRTATDKEIKHFLKKYQASFPGFTDKDHMMSQRFQASVMPEVVVIKNGIVTYQGAIDNWYVALGKNRPKPTEFYLRNAIEATLNGNPVLTPRTKAVGCLINH